MLPADRSLKTCLPPQQTVWILLAAWFAAYAWRPFLLGFYSDDYLLILQPVSGDLSPSQLLDFQMRAFSNRPVSGLVAFVYVLLLQDHAFLWHAVSAVISLITGGLLWLILERLNRIENPLDHRQLAWLVAVWWLLPTSFGFMSWPIFLVHLPVMVFFLLSFLLLVTDPRLAWPSATAALLCYCLSLATHEGFYFQYLVPFALLLRWHAAIELSVKRWTLWLSLFSLAQVSAIAFNRLATIGPRKPFDLDFILTRITSVIQNSRFLVDVLIPIAIVSVATLIVLRTIRRSRQRSGELNDGQAQILIFLGGLVLSLVVYLGAGYSILPFGLESRSTMCVSIFTILLWFQLMKHEPRFLHYSKTAAALILIILSGLTAVQGYHWHKSWQLQNEVMGLVPDQELTGLKKRTIVLCLVPNYHGPVSVFEDTWSLNPAVESHYPGLRESKLQFLPHKNTGFRAAGVSFIDGRLTYHPFYSGHKLPKYKAESLYIWNYFAGQLWRAEGDVSIHPHLDPESFHMDNLVLVHKVSDATGKD